MSKKIRKCLKASVHGFTGIFTLRLKVTVLERMKSETLVIFIFIIIISQSWVLCSSCWGSSSGSWTWSMVSVDCRHYAPDPPLNDKTHSETHTTLQTVYSLYVTLYMCDTHRNTGRVCPHPCYTHWRSHERSDTHRTPPSVTHTHTHFIKLNICHCLIQLYISFQTLCNCTANYWINSFKQNTGNRSERGFKGNICGTVYIDFDWTWKHPFHLKIK